MKKFDKTPILVISIACLVVVEFSLVKFARAAITPPLGAATTYGILANTYVNTTAGTTVNGDVGFTTGPAVAPAGTHTNYGSGAPYSTAGTDQGSALSTLALEACTFNFAPGAINLATDTTHGTAGVYTPGVYCSTGAMNVGGPITLSGSGTYIFRPVGALTSAAGAVVTLSGASACDVFWTPTGATTLAANTIFSGTIISDSGITLNANNTLSGRALAFGGTVTTDTDSITVPTCTSSGTINVVKAVVNDSGGTKTIADFPLFVNGSSVTSGATNSFAAPGSYTITETYDPAAYAQSFSGDCDSSGHISLSPGDAKFCIITNDDIGVPVVPPVPPLIDLVKVPSPLALPGGPGSVTYTYTLRNIGTVPATNISLNDDSCSPVNLVSGDTNSNSILDVTETWTYSCSTTLSATHTNTAVVTGLANGITATDIASATVIVGAPTVPPLIHVTKIPSSFTLLYGGGAVTYTESVTNPGAAALSNINLSDDKCSPLNYVSGDTNGDSKLDPSETWVYTCRTNLAQTTTNTAIVSGEANGLTARDFAFATVVVATVPKLPNTGLVPLNRGIPWLSLY